MTDKVLPAWVEELQQQWMSASPEHPSGYTYVKWADLVAACPTQSEPDRAGGAVNIPRRCRLDLMVAAERAIYDAAQAVEAMPADVRLTDAVILLGQARDKVADFVDAAALPGAVPAQEEK